MNSESSKIDEEHPFSTVSEAIAGLAAFVRAPSFRARDGLAFKTPFFVFTISAAHFGYGFCLLEVSLDGEGENLALSGNLSFVGNDGYLIRPLIHPSRGGMEFKFVPPDAVCTLELRVEHKIVPLPVTSKQEASIQAATPAPELPRKIGGLHLIRITDYLDRPSAATDDIRNMRFDVGWNPGLAAGELRLAASDAESIPDGIPDRRVPVDLDSEVNMELAEYAGEAWLVFDDYLRTLDRSQVQYKIGSEEGGFHLRATGDRVRGGVRLEQSFDEATGAQIEIVITRPPN